MKSQLKQFVLMLMNYIRYYITNRTQKKTASPFLQIRGLEVYFQIMSQLKHFNCLNVHQLHNSLHNDEQHRKENYFAFLETKCDDVCAIYNLQDFSILT